MPQRHGEQHPLLGDLNCAMNPSRLAEPQALAVVFTALVLVAALQVFTVDAGAADEARNDERPADADLSPRMGVTGPITIRTPSDRRIGVPATR